MIIACLLSLESASFLSISQTLLKLFSPPKFTESDDLTVMRALDRLNVKKVLKGENVGKFGFQDAFYRFPTY
jgi:hypothetical protein